MERSSEQGVRSTTSRARAALAWVPGLVTGAGFGAMLDGLLFHELLHWHGFLSDVEGFEMDSMASMDENLVANGMFHAFALIVSILGVALIWRAGRNGRLPDGRFTIGSVVMGWALFDIVDGVVLHLGLGLHHLYQPDFQTESDLLYVLTNVVLLALGATFAASGRGAHGDQTST
ncbi:MAG: hypothetical protein JWM86_1004 [Thermoleophilia bacterium]|nr:hypothetical protein [Thermoleophilia bacterium]